jgi:hypothetical protein
MAPVLLEMTTRCRGVSGLAGPLVLAAALSACGGGGDASPVDEPGAESGARAAGDADLLPDAASDAATPTTDAACQSKPFTDPHSAARTACMFAPGAKVEDTLGDVAAMRAALTHVIVITQENHTVDAMFGLNTSTAKLNVRASPGPRRWACRVPPSDWPCRTPEVDDGSLPESLHRPVPYPSFSLPFHLVLNSRFSLRPVDSAS